MRSPGRPSVARREDRLRFWAGIARGMLRVRPPRLRLVCRRQFVRGGSVTAAGCRPVCLAPLSGRYLSFPEREEIAILRVRRMRRRQIARRMGRSPSTVSRELRRNAATRAARWSYRATAAQWHADRRASRPKIANLAANHALARIRARPARRRDRQTGWRAGPGPVPWIGRRHGRRTDRRWARSWSPEQIAQPAPVDFPDDESMRISHEAIYQALYVQGRGALERELAACLRTGRALRVPRARTRGRGKKFVTAEVMISERPAEVEDRAVPGHWEGDLIWGWTARRSAPSSNARPGSRCCCTCPRWKATATDLEPRTARALAGHGAEAVRDAIASAITTLPEQLRRSLTWDQGAEMARHAQLRIDAGSRSTSAIRTVPGSAAPTRTPTACCASTSPRAPT